MQAVFRTDMSAVDHCNIAQICARWGLCDVPNLRWSSVLSELSFFLVHEFRLWTRREGGCGWEVYLILQSAPPRARLAKIT